MKSNTQRSAVNASCLALSLACLVAQVLSSMSQGTSSSESAPSAAFGQFRQTMQRSIDCTRLRRPTSCKPASRHGTCGTWHLRCTAAQDVIVVGGGVGGLATAGRLTRKGLSVTVLEKNQEVGGRAQSVELGSCRFDTGPSLLLFPDKYREAFEALGSSLEEHVTIQRVDPAAYRVFFGDGSSLDLLNDHAAMAQQLEEVEPGAGEGFLQFLQMARTSLDMGVPNFIDQDFTEWRDVAKLAGLLPMLPKINLLDLLGQHDGRLSRFFRDPRLRALFTFQDLYVGLSPYNAPAVFSLLAGTELTDGVWYPLGGFRQVVRGLVSAAQACGVSIRTGCEVARILTDPASGSVVGVQLTNGESLEASIVVCNRDLPAAYKLLMSSRVGSEGGSSSSSSSGGGSSAQAVSSVLSSGGRPEQQQGEHHSRPESAAAAAAVHEYAARQHEALGRLKYSTGVISFNWAVGRRLEVLQHHNVFLSDEYQESWVPAAAPSQLRRRPNFYVHVPARTDPSAAPPGCDSVMVLLPVASMQQMGPGGYAELVQAGRQRVLQAFRDSGVGDIEGSITHELVITPDEWAQRYGLRHGAAFGLAHGLDQLSVFRPGTKDGTVGGLYFVGASTRPGNGVPLCLIGSKLTAERVLQDLASQR